MSPNEYPPKGIQNNLHLISPAEDTELDITALIIYQLFANRTPEDLLSCNSLRTEVLDFLQPNVLQSSCLGPSLHGTWYQPWYYLCSLSLQPSWNLSGARYGGGGSNPAHPRHGSLCTTISSACDAYPSGGDARKTRCASSPCMGDW